MLTDTELLDAITNAPIGWTTQSTLLAIGRNVEAAVLNKQARLLREAEMAGAAHFIGGVVALGINGGNSDKESSAPAARVTPQYPRDGWPADAKFTFKREEAPGVAVRVPWGSWALGDGKKVGRWYPNPAVQLSASEQRAQNEANGYECPGPDGGGGGVALGDDQP